MNATDLPVSEMTPPVTVNVWSGALTDRPLPW